MESRGVARRNGPQKRRRIDNTLSNERPKPTRQWHGASFCLKHQLHKNAVCRPITIANCRHGRPAVKQREESIMWLAQTTNELDMIIRPIRGVLRETEDRVAE